MTTQTENQTDYSSIGDINLALLDKASHFTEWMYDQAKPYLKGNILEIGSGSGTYSKKIVRDFPTNKIVLSELDDTYFKKLTTQFVSNSILVSKLNIEKDNDFKETKLSFDSAFAFNVLEHVEHDVTALNNIYNNLNPDGVFVMLVPAHMFLYNRIDKNIGHFRRYNRKMLKDKLSNTPFTIEKMYYFNALSIFGWFLNGNILKKEVIDDNLLSLFDKIVPLMQFIEKYILRRKIGISLVAVLRK